MPKPTCPKCEWECRVAEQKLFVIETYDNPPEPYKVWMAALYECPGCFIQVVSGYGARPIGEQFQEGFDHLVSNIIKDEQHIFMNEHGHAAKK